MGAWEWWMPLHQATLSTFPIDPAGRLASKPETRILPIVNEFYSGVYLIDDKRVIVPIEVAQELLHLDERQVVDPEQLDEQGLPKVIGTDPARATIVLARAIEGIDSRQLRDVVERELEKFRARINGDRARFVGVPAGVSVKTWEQQQAQFIGPIEKERELMRTLFSIVYLVCAGLVLSIFWGIVHEKTRDIGILRSIGASRAGVVWMFLRYGFIIGLIGSIVGLGLAVLVIRNINAIHEAMGDPPLWLALTMSGLAVGAVGATIVASFRGRLMPVMTWSLGAAVC
jgi:ABC-type lipoprotein release transport system permease subunit